MLEIVNTPHAQAKPEANPRAMTQLFVQRVVGFGLGDEYFCIQKVVLNT